MHFYRYVRSILEAWPFPDIHDNLPGMLSEFILPAPTLKSLSACRLLARYENCEFCQSGRVGARCTEKDVQITRAASHAAPPQRRPTTLHTDS